MCKGEEHQVGVGGMDPTHPLAPEATPAGYVPKDPSTAGDLTNVQGDRQGTKQFLSFPENPATPGVLRHRHVAMPSPTGRAPRPCRWGLRTSFTLPPASL